MEWTLKINASIQAGIIMKDRYKIPRYTNSKHAYEGKRSNHIAIQRYSVVYKRLSYTDKSEQPTTEINQKNITNASRRLRLNKSNEIARPYICNQTKNECRYVIEINP